MSRWDITAIVLDFDGVLVDSNRIKRDAFFAVVEERHHPHLRRALRHGSELPRRDLLARVLFDAGMRGRLLEDAVDRHVRRYSAVVTRAIGARGLTRGIAPLLAQLSRRYALYISSTTPQHELDAYVRRFGMRRLVRGVFGWPRPKADVVRQVAVNGTGRRQVVLVGDGQADRRAARTAGCRFVGVANEFNGWLVDPARNQIPSLLDLPALLERRSFSSRRRAFSSR